MLKGTGVYVTGKIAAAVAATALVLGVAGLGRAEDPAAPPVTPAAPAAPAAAATPAAAPGASLAPADAQAFTQSIPESDVTFDLVPIPGGKFKIGSPDAEKDREKHEGPQFEVEIEPFYMGKYEVTQAEYNLFLNNYPRLEKAPPIADDKLVDAVTYPTPLYELDAGPIFQKMGRGGQFPAVIMSQYAARQYTKWLSKKTGRFYRLPTEAEWEYACRAGTTTAYHFGDDPALLGEYAWYYDNADLNGEVAYRVVGQKKPNPWGLHDMHGNVAELVVDWYQDDAYAPFAGKTVKWNEVISWPKKQYPRLARGGGFESEAEGCRSAARHELKGAKINNRDPQLPRSPHWYSNGFWVGFRLVAPVNQPSEAEKQKFWDDADKQIANILQQHKDKTRREVIEAPAGAAAAQK